uniref:type VI secretion system-associated protein TagF n=1 Tax=Pseudomonas viridiflava TaxID=33069 RepID=UPI0013C2CB68
AWLDAYLVSPLWRFAVPANLLGSQPVAGVMMPSIDRVGRYFPLTIACLLPADAAEDFHACRDYLVPDWDIGPHGDDIDLHRHRRDLLHGRVTAFGQRL